MQRQRGWWGSKGSWQVLWGLVGLLWGSGVLAQSVVEQLPASLLGSRWYSITVLGSRSGWSQQSLQRVTRAGQVMLESHEHTVVRVQLGDQTLAVSRREVRVYDSQLQLIQLQQSSDQAGRESQLQAHREGDSWQVSRTGPDGPRQQSLPLPADFGNELQVIRELLSGELEPGAQREFATFDAELMDFDRVQLQVARRVSEPVEGWEIEARGQLLPVSTYSLVDVQGVLVRQTVPEMMGMMVERVSEAEALATVTPLPLSSSLPAPAAITDATQLTRLQVVVHDEGGQAESLFPVTARQQVAGAGAQALLTVVAQPLPQQPLRLPISDPALAEYLQPSDLAQSDDPAITALSAAIVGGERDSWAVAQRLVDWVYRKVKKVESEPRPVTATEVREAMSGDCTEHSVLLAALAQAAGLPVQVVVGLAYDQGAFHYHAWNAVWVGQWVEVDATWNQMVVDAGHLQLASGTVDRTASARMNLVAGRTMKGLQLEVADFTRRGE